MFHPHHWVENAQATATELLEADTKVKESHANGNGSHALPTPPPVKPSNGIHHANGNGSSTIVPLTASLDLATDPQSAGQIETVAATRVVPPPPPPPPRPSPSSMESSSGNVSAAAQNADIARQAAEAKAAAEARATRSAAGTPYAAVADSKWSKIKGYSTFQRSLEIWGFAFQFAFKYFLLGQKWSYGKQGMVPEAVSSRKKELAIWLREGLVRLGPTFIKVSGG